MIIQGLLAYESICTSSELRFIGMQHSHRELKLYLKCKYTKDKAKHQSLVGNVTDQHLQRGQIGRPYFVIRTERG